MLEFQVGIRLSEIASFCVAGVLMTMWLIVLKRRTALKSQHLHGLAQNRGISRNCRTADRRCRNSSGAHPANEMLSYLLMKVPLKSNLNEPTGVFDNL